MRATRAGLVTEEEFLALPESMDKVELIDGEVIVSPSPTQWHQSVLGRVYFALETWARSQAGAVSVVLSPCDVRFARGRILQPDLLVVLDRVPLDRKGPLDRIPEICLEVVSDRVYDRVTKRLIYAESGVRELWLVEPAKLVERWHGERLGVAEEARDRLRTPLLPGFELDVPALFSE